MRPVHAAADTMVCRCGGSRNGNQTQTAIAVYLSKFPPTKRTFHVLDVVVVIAALQVHRVRSKQAGGSDLLFAMNSPLNTSVSRLIVFYLQDYKWKV